MDILLHESMHQSTVGMICTSIHGVYTHTVLTYRIFHSIRLEGFIISRCLDAEDFNNSLVL